MQSSRPSKNDKRQYEKPRLSIIELVADEVLGVGCKFADSGTAPLDPLSCVGAGCSQPGS
ncbi:hypothetical protein JXA40_03645 [bacterium]|nr:hypothetical protein [candidate division CSSED10-310 bacterium]